MMVVGDDDDNDGDDDGKYNSSAVVHGSPFHSLRKYTHTQLVRI